MKKLVDKFMKQDLKDKYQQTLYNLIKYEFPKIKNLKIEYISDRNSFTVTFDTMEDYTSQQVLDKVNEYRYSKKLKK